MAPKPTNWAMYGKMALAGGICCIGGPALIYWVAPTEEELFLKYNPELQKRSLENRQEKQEDFDNFVKRLKVLSKSDKPIWEAAAIADKEDRESKIASELALINEARARKEEIRLSNSNPTSPSPPATSSSSSSSSWTSWMWGSSSNSRNSEYRFDFGKYKGKTLAEVDRLDPDYITSCVGQAVTEQRKDLKSAIETFYTQRGTGARTEQKEPEMKLADQIEERKEGMWKDGYKPVPGGSL
ncbi:Assembly factor cbp4 [Lachnellula occidentalis]|uniref:Cytochrome b mRNA-processing protein 4 n=1 Tax=Lachnellula occidentalis TaxID=215460 RepID=A0A8H8RJR5_9HELO|nr:Assembly factor cbp4 [Lachnellula occidentalis]